MRTRPDHFRKGSESNSESPSSTAEETRHDQEVVVDVSDEASLIVDLEGGKEPPANVRPAKAPPRPTTVAPTRKLGMIGMIGLLALVVAASLMVRQLRRGDGEGAPASFSTTGPSTSTTGPNVVAPGTQGRTPAASPTTAPKAVAPGKPAPPEEPVPILAAGKVPAPREGKVYWGAFRPDAPSDRSVVEDLRASVGEWPAMMLWFQAWDGEPDFDIESARWLQERGIVPVITWEPWVPKEGTDQPKYSLARIAKGKHDDYVTSYAESVREFGGPVMLRPFHEMDGSWYPWAGLENGNSTEDFIRAWRHLHRVFDRVGATNVTWIWSVNHASKGGEANSIGHYWPGSKFVDWIGVSGYNWSTTTDWSRWREFYDVFIKRYQDLLGFEKPIVLTEVASAEVGGDKPQWIRNAFQSMVDQFPAIGAALWYDRQGSGDQDWRIESSRKSRAAFREVLDRNSVLSAPRALKAALKG